MQLTNFIFCLLMATVPLALEQNNEIETKFAAIIFKAIQNINYQSDRKVDIVSRYKQWTRTTTN